MSHALILALAMALDGILGEPERLWSRVPHPAVLLGRAVAALETRMNRGRDRIIKGLVATLILGAGALLCGQLLAQIGWAVELVLATILLAQKSLCDHVAAVAEGLETDIVAGRAAVARIVSRDTADMQPDQVARSAIESAAENLSDGIIAPAFWFLVGGLPLMLLYKVINTADSMIGYRTERFEAFGKAAARLDDALNWLPARLTALLIALRRGGLRDWAGIMADAKLHKSPNAGWPEAAAARALGVALAGPRSYGGQMRDLPWVHPKGRRTIAAPEIRAAVDLLWQVWTVALCCVAVFALI